MTRDANVGRVGRSPSDRAAHGQTAGGDPRESARAPGVPWPCRWPVYGGTAGCVRGGWTRTMEDMARFRRTSGVDRLSFGSRRSKHSWGRSQRRRHRGRSWAARLPPLPQPDVDRPARRAGRRGSYRPGRHLCRRRTVAGGAPARPARRVHPAPDPRGARAPAPAPVAAGGRVGRGAGRPGTARLVRSEPPCSHRQSRQGHDGPGRAARPSPPTRASLAPR